MDVYIFEKKLRVGLVRVSLHGHCEGLLRGSLGGHICGKKWS